MLIFCPNCATSYMIDRGWLGVAGRSVRCARCKTTWFADPLSTNAPTNALIEPEKAGADAAISDGGLRPPLASPPPVDNSRPHKVTSSREEFRATGAPDGEPDHQPEPVQIDAVATMPTTNDDLASGEPMTVAEAPPLVPPVEPPALLEDMPSQPDPDDAESFAARRDRLRKRRKRSIGSSRWTALILVLFAFNVALVGARNEIVRFLPQTASLFAAIGLPVNLRQLKFENVRIVRDNTDGKGVLVVEGTIVSNGSATVDVPRLRFAARNTAGQDVYTWTEQPSRTTLDPGGKVDFRTRIASPPAEAANVIVRFVSAEDKEAKEK